MSASTPSTPMTTNNPGIAGLSAPLADVPVAAGSPAAPGLPDAELIAQLANALFAALPGRPTVPGLAADAQAAPPTSALPAAPPLGPEGEFASLPVGPYVPPTSGFSPPGDAELRAAPASLSSVGGVASPTTAAAPPDESPLYFLDPAQPGLPGTAVGLGPSSAARAGSGAMPTAPSPPSAFAQPAEPSLRGLPATAGGAAALAPTTVNGSPTLAPFSFRPELVPLPATTPAVGGSTPPASIPSAALPQGAGSQPVADEASIPSTAGLPGDPAIPAGAPFVAANPPAAPGFYFLDAAALAIPDNALSGFDPFGFPGFTRELESSAFPFDSRGQDAPARSAQDATALGVH